MGSSCSRPSSAVSRESSGHAPSADAHKQAAATHVSAATTSAPTPKQAPGPAPARAPAPAPAPGLTAAPPTQPQPTALNAQPAPPPPVLEPPASLPASAPPAGATSAQEPPRPVPSPQPSAEQQASSSQPAPEPARAEQPAAGAGGQEGDRKLLFIHYNDVYNIEEIKGKGGAARFTAKVREFQHHDPIILCSGDCFNPSTLSTILLGAQMPPVMNAVGTHACVYGNHDFDFGLPRMQELIKACTFPWLMANVLDKRTKRTYNDAPPTCMLERHGVKVGVVGLVESEWLESLGAVDTAAMAYLDFSEAGRRHALELREQGAEVVVALTHLRISNNVVLAEKCGDVFDLILAGHEHHYEAHPVGPQGILMTNSGTDFQDLTSIEMVVPPRGSGRRPSVARYDRHEIDPSTVPAEDPEMARIVHSFMGEMEKKLSVVVGRTLCELDVRHEVCRRRESNFANFVSDMLRAALPMKVDMFILNAGNIRADGLWPPGPLTLRDLVTFLPYVDGMMVLEVKGSAVVAALENGVGRSPMMEGRFPQPSGLSYAFDESKPPGQRIELSSVKVGGKPIDLDRVYRLGCPSFVGKGNDGYHMFKGCKVLLDDENSIPVPTAIRNHFRSLQVLSRIRAVQKYTWEECANKWLASTIRRGGVDADGDGVPDDLGLDGFDLPARPVYRETDTTGIAVIHGSKLVINPVLEGRVVELSSLRRAAQEEGATPAPLGDQAQA